MLLVTCFCGFPGSSVLIVLAVLSIPNGTGPFWGISVAPMIPIMFFLLCIHKGTGDARLLRNSNFRVMCVCVPIILTTQIILTILKGSGTS